MNKISMDKKYRTRAGHVVKVLCTDRESTNGHHVVALVYQVPDDPSVYYYSVNGFFIVGEHATTEVDLIEVNDYYDIPIDARVSVKINMTDDFLPAHFAGLDEHGRPTAWISSLSGLDNVFSTSWMTSERTPVSVCIKEPENAPTASEGFVDVELRVDKELQDSIETIAKLKGITIDQLVCEAINQELARDRCVSVTFNAMLQLTKEQYEMLLQLKETENGCNTDMVTGNVNKVISQIVSRYLSPEKQKHL